MINPAYFFNAKRHGLYIVITNVWSIFVILPEHDEIKVLTVQQLDGCDTRIKHPQTLVNSAPGHHLKLKKTLRSRWGFGFCGLVTGC
jgi:hypothetical protein